MSTDAPSLEIKSLTRRAKAWTLVAGLFFMWGLLHFMG